MYAELLLQRYAESTPKLLATKSHAAGEDYALSTSHDYLLFVTEIVPEGSTTDALEARAIEWIVGEKSGTFADAVRHCFTKGGKVMVQSFSPEVQGDAPAKLNRNGASIELLWEKLFPNADAEVEALSTKIAHLKNNLPEEVKAGFFSVKALSEEIKQAFILRNQKTELFAALNEVHATLSARQDAMKGEMDAVFAERFAEIEPKVKALCAEVQTVTDGKAYRESLKELQNELRDLEIDRERKAVLFQHIRDTFDQLNERSQSEREAFQAEAEENYQTFSPKLVDALALVQRTEAFMDTREYLKNLQSEIRDAKLSKLHREAFRAQFDEIFTTLNARQDEERSSFLATCEYNFGQLRQQLDEATSQIETVTNYNQVRDVLKGIQAEMREQKLTKDHRDQLWAGLQDAFNALNAKQNAERETFLTAANANYDVLKTKIEEGLRLAQESNDFKGTREYLKTVQSEFWELKLTREQRDELKPKVNDAFVFLNQRADAFYSERQRTWLERLSDKKIRLEQVRVSVEQQLDKDVFFLAQQKEKIENSWEYKDSETVRNAYDAKIKQVEGQIAEKQSRLADIDRELKDIADKLNERTQSASESIATVEEEVPATVETPIESVSVGSDEN